MSGPFAYPRKGKFHGKLPEQPPHPSTRRAPQAPNSRHAPMPWPMRKARPQLHRHRHPSRPHYSSGRRRNRCAIQSRRNMRRLSRPQDPKRSSARPGPILAQATPSPSSRTLARGVAYRAPAPWGSPPRPSKRTDGIGPPIVYGFPTFCRQGYKTALDEPLRRK